MLRRIFKILSLEVVRQKIVFTLLILLFFRFITSFSIPAVNREVLVQVFSSNELFQVVNMLSGGLFLSLSILTLGLGPYITASYIFQILAFAFPTIKEMFQGGPIERKMLTQYMRLATFPLAVFQGLSFIIGINRITQSIGLPPIIEIKSTLHLIAVLAILVFGAYVAMWFGELITQYGVGGGSSLIIAVGILASFPYSLGGVWKLLTLNWQKLVFVGLILVLIILSIVVTLAVRKIAVVYASRVRSSGMVGAPTEIFIPINPGGVMPVIFAVAVLSGFSLLVRVLVGYVDPSNWFYDILYRLNMWLNNPFIYSMLSFVFTLAFAYFSTLLVLNPKNIAENLQQQGAFIPGIRPGKETESFLSRLIKRVVVVGGVLLGFITVLPTVVRYILSNTAVQNIGLGVTGTGVLIVAAVIVDIIKQLKSVEATLVNVKRYF